MYFPKLKQQPAAKSRLSSAASVVIERIEARVLFSTQIWNFGTGNWDTTSAFSAGPTNWTNGNAAQFGGTATGSTVTIDNGPVTVTGLTFDSNGAGDTIAGTATNNLNFAVPAGAPGGTYSTSQVPVNVSSAAPAADTINAPVTLINAGNPNGNDPDLYVNAAAGDSLTFNGPITLSSPTASDLSALQVNNSANETGTVNFTGNIFANSDGSHATGRYIGFDQGTVNLTGANIDATYIFDGDAGSTNLTSTNTAINIDGTQDYGYLALGFNGNETSTYDMHGGSLNVVESTVYLSHNPSQSIMTIDQNAQVTVDGGIFMTDNGGNTGSQIVVKDGSTFAATPEQGDNGGQYGWIIGGAGKGSQQSGKYNVFTEFGNASSVTAPDSAHNGIDFEYRMGNGGDNGFYNLDGGTLTTGAITSGDGTAWSAQDTTDNDAFFNFDGGTLIPSATNSNFVHTTLTGTNSTGSGAAPHLIDNSGGAIINTNGNSISINQPLQAPAGEGVTSTTIAIPAGMQGSGYQATPLLYINPTISDTTGYGATAIANMAPDGSGGLKVVSITITNPGQNYTAVPTLVQTGGVSTGTVTATLPTLSIGANTSGGLTKNGLGTLTLSGADTYTGNTTVNDGTLEYEADPNFATASTVTIASGATLALDAYATDTIAALFVNGVQQSAGTYTYGTGSLMVTTGPANGPAWLAATSHASFSGGTLTVTGPATIISDPTATDGDDPVITASGGTAQLTIAPTTGSPVDVHVGGITLTDGAGITMESVNNIVGDAARSHSNHNVLVIGTTSEASDPMFSISSTSRLDMMDNDLVVHTASGDSGGYTMDSTVNGLIEGPTNPGSPNGWGRDGGAWDGNGLTSSYAQNQDQNIDGYETVQLGEVDNGDLATSYTTWQVGSAVETLGGGDIIVKYTYTGDFNLDGQVNFTDTGTLGLYYPQSAQSAPYTSQWAFGDTDGNTTIEFHDAGNLGLDFGNGTGSLSANDPTLL